jgi:hypothetical protein
MYRSTQWLNAHLSSRKLCPPWPRVPIALVVAALVVTAFALTVALGGIGMHHSVTASGIAWGQL